MKHSPLAFASCLLLLACQQPDEASDDGVTPTFAVSGLNASMIDRAAVYDHPHGEWTVELRAEAWGRGTLTELPPRPAVYEGDIARRDWSGIQEWYAPHRHGVKHGFDLLERPDGEGSLQVVLRIDTDLVVTGTPDEITFLDAQGDLALAYQDLVVLDADGHTLDSWMTLEGDALRLVVDDSDAVWPLWIDPLVLPPAPSQAVYDIVIQNNSNRNWTQGVAAVLPEAAPVNAVFPIGQAPTDLSTNQGRTYGFLHGSCDVGPGDDDGDAARLITGWGPTLVLDDNAFIVPALAAGASTTVTIQAAPGEVLSFAARIVGANDDAVLMHAAGNANDPTIDLFGPGGAPLETVTFDIGGYDVNSQSATNGNAASCAASCPVTAGCFVAPGGTVPASGGGPQTGTAGCRPFDVFIDGDGDGFGDVPATGANTPSCTATPGFALVDGDCNDSDPSVNPEATEVPGNAVDEDCNGQVGLAAGDLVITEVMANPASSNNSRGEWFEIFNPRAFDIDLENLVVTRLSNNNAFTVAASGGNPGTVIEAGTFYTLGRNSMNNGGYTPDYVYPNAFRIRNNNETLTLTSNGTLVDAASWSNSSNGASRQLDPSVTDAVSNDDEANVCDGFTPFGDGDFATPGAINDPCDFTISFDFLWTLSDSTIIDATTTLMTDGAGRFTTGNAGEGTYERTMVPAGQRLSWTYDNAPNVIYTGVKPFGEDCWPTGSTMTGFDTDVVTAGEWGETGCP